MCALATSQTPPTVGKTMHRRLLSLATHYNSSPQLQRMHYSPPSPQECRILGARSCTAFEIAILGTAGGGGNTSHVFSHNLGTEHLIDTVPSPNDSQEVALSIYARNDLISVAIKKEKEMSQSLLTCPSRLNKFEPYNYRLFLAVQLHDDSI